MLELGWIYNKACVEETPRPAASHGTKYIINESDMKIILNVIIETVSFVKLNVIKKLYDQNGKGEKLEELKHQT